MYLKQLRLHQFRSYSQLAIMPPKGLTVFVGENGAGKTNLLEAIHLCCLGRSHRTSDDQDMIKIGETTAAVHATVSREGREDDVGVRLFRAQKQKKIIYVGGKTVLRIGELMGHMTCVMFSPEDMDIIKGSPQLRRRFIDMLLAQSLSGYFYALQHYNAVLKQRNALLKMMARDEQDKVQLFAWDDQLSSAAVPLVRARREAVEKLAQLSAEHYSFISGRPEEMLGITYRSILADSTDIKQDFQKLLEQSRNEDMRRLSTFYGPHRDELILTLSGEELRSFGSQGQIRSAVLAMRLSQIDILTKAQGEPPLLLLDDVLSELDSSRRSRLLSGISHVQTMLTCTEINDVHGLNPACILKVQAGQISQS
ncbi:MAG: DNA replication/repair protein RecF [Clostridiales bacterium]|nr:DNA replication/repair protein RecF [Clostridiales bacterium]